jgi:hypothetical protein
MSRGLVCPSCQRHFEYRDFLRGRACPSCEVYLGFSVPYRVVLAIFAVSVLLLLYRALLSAGIVLSLAWLVLSVPVAFIARFFFISNVSCRLRSLGIAKCPNCGGALNRTAIRAGPFDCPHCLKEIRPVRAPSYRWVRGGLCAVLAIGAARLKEFDWSFLIFVVSLYALPALFFWDIFAMDLSPPMRFEPAQSSVQMLGIGKG